MPAVPRAPSRIDIARDLIRRKRCRTSLHSFALNIDVPTAPTGAMCPEEELTGPAASLMPIHHAKILDVCEKVITTPFGRGLIMAPPGTAKSTEVDLIAIPWAMGRTPGTRIILTSYASKLAEKQSRRARQVAESQLYRNIWENEPIIDKDSDPEWTLKWPHTNARSELLAAGLLAGITGNRANGAVVDDPVAGREEADSPATRTRTLDAFQDDLLTRLLPGAWLLFIMTRWNELDLAGEILPHDYKGQSGLIRCRDGLDWHVLNLPAKAEHADDPLGRKIGDYIWPEYYPKKHWQMFEHGAGPTRQRTWSSLYQQRPSPQGSGDFKREMFKLYDSVPDDVRTAKRIFCGDYAVTPGKNDFTEMGVGSMAPNGDLYMIDWFYEQCDTGKSTEKTLELLDRHNINLAFNEGGVIDKSMRPAINAAIRDWNRDAVAKHGGRRIYVDIRSLSSIMDKVAKCAAIQARAATGAVWLPRNAPWTDRIIDQLCALPAGRWDDAADVMGLFGRAMEQWQPPDAKKIERKDGIVPFTAAWLEWKEDATPRKRWR